MVCMPSIFIKTSQCPMIFIFSIVLGAEYLSYVKSIETHARPFLPLNISAVGTVQNVTIAGSGSGQKINSDRWTAF